jgi:hypothetical protein
LNAFSYDVAKGVHNLSSDTFKVRLCSSANEPAAADDTLSDLTGITETNLSSNAVTLGTHSEASGTYSWAVPDLTLSASGGALPSFQYVVLYNDTSTNDSLIGYWDLGFSCTLSDQEDVTIDMPTYLLTIG